MNVINQVRQLHDSGYNSAQIMNELGLTAKQVAGYKSALTRKRYVEQGADKSIGGEYRTINVKVDQNKYIVIPTELLYGSNKEKVPKGFTEIEVLVARETLVELLNKAIDSAFGEENQSRLEETIKPREKKSHLKGKEKIRNIILSHLEDGEEYDIIIKDPRLQNVPKGTIRAYIAHYSRGSYQ